MPHTVTDARSSVKLRSPFIASKPLKQLAVRQRHPNRFRNNPS
jgi:hypothetical protein